MNALDVNRINVNSPYKVWVDGYEGAEYYGLEVF